MAVDIMRVCSVPALAVDKKELTLVQKMNAAFRYKKHCHCVPKDYFRIHGMIVLAKYD